MNGEKLSLDTISQKLESLEGWELLNMSITKTFPFGDFKESMDFVAQVAFAAEEANHHPDILIQYNRVTLTLSTHAEGGLTRKDFSLAEKIEGLLQPEEPQEETDATQTE